MSIRLNKNKFLSEKGAVTLFVLIAIIFFLIVSLSVYSSNKNRIMAQSKEIEAIKENYNKDLEHIDEIYSDLAKKELKTVFIKESSINSANKVYYNLNEWTNENIIVNIIVNSESNPDTELQVKVISKKTGNAVLYNKNQVDNNQVIIKENSKVIAIFGDKKQEFDLDKFDKEIPVLSYESFFRENNGKYISGNWTNKETYTTISVKEEISGIPEMYYSTDKQTWTKFDFSMSNGIYQELDKYYGKEIWTLRDGRIENLYFRAKDRAGNYSNISDVYQLKYDLTAPSKPEIENKYNDNWTNVDIKIAARSTDALSKVAKIEYSYDEIQWKSDWGEALQTNGNESSTSKIWNNNFNGKVYVRATDNAGNVSQTSYTILKKDSIEPIVNITPNGETYYVPAGGKVTLKVIINAEDTGSGLKNLQYAWSTSNTVEPTKWENFENGKEILKSNVTSGTYYLWTNVVDNAGNRASKIKVSNPFIVSPNETESFKITITTTPTTWTNGNVNVDITYGSRLIQGKKAGMGLSISEAQSKASESSATNMIVTNNNYYIYAEAMDSNGNKVTATKLITNIDKTAPTVTLTPNGGTYTAQPNNSAAIISTTLTAKDTGGSDLGTLQYQITTSNTLPADDDVNWKTFTNGSTMTENKSGGTWYLYTRVLDKAGNRATSIQKSNPYNINYKIEYNANGGTGAPEDQIKENNKTLVLSNTKPTRAGYIFAGWSTSSNSSTADYQPGSNYTENSSITLYAIWKAKQVEVTFVKNTTSTDNTSAVQTFTCGVAGQKFTDKGWNKSGYTLLGWNTDRNATTQQYTTLSEVADSWIDANSPKVTLYAIWKINNYTLTVNPNGGIWNGTTSNSTFTQSYGSTKEITNPIAPAGYKIIFNGNGGSTPAEQTSTKLFTGWTNSGNGTLSGTTYTFGSENATLTANYKNNSITLPTASRTGYTFQGWYDAASGGNKIGNGGESYTPTTAKTLYAHWTVNSYYVDLNMSVNGTVYANGYNQRVYVGLTVDGINKGYIGDYYSMHPYGTKWEIYGLKLDGINVPYTASGILGDSYGSVMVDLNTIELAVNNSNYGSVSSNNLLIPKGKNFTTSGTTLTMEDGRKVTASVKEATGYTTKLINWSQASGVVNSATKITANFERIINNYTLTVNPNGGAWNGTTSNSTFTQSYGSTKEITNPIAPAGYKIIFNGNGGSTPAEQTSTKVFTGWTNSGSGTLSGTTYTFGAGNGTLTANYKNNSITLPTPTRTGHTFQGWYDAASGGNKIGNGGASYTPTTAKTLYAHWTVNNYTLTVNPNGGTWNGTASNSTVTQNYGSTKAIANPTAPAGYKVIYNGNGGNTPAEQISTKSFTGWTNSGSGTLTGTTYTFGVGNGTLTANYKNNSITLPTASRTGYTFQGWYDAANGGNKIGNGGASYTPTTAKTLYAHWTVNNYTLTVNPGGSKYTQNYNSTKAITAPTQNYTVSFNSNGGSAISSISSGRDFVKWDLVGVGSMSSTTTNPTTYTFGAGNDILTAVYNSSGKQITLPTPTRMGYMFLGWYKESSLTNLVGKGGTNYTPTATTTLYAKWQDNTMPVMGMLTASPTGWTNSNVTITGKSQDLGSGISYYQFSTNGNLTASSSGWVKINNTKQEISQTYTATQNGTYYFYTKDEAGNINKKSIVINNIDKIAPTATHSTSAKSQNVTEVTINIKVSDSLSGINTITTTSSNLTKVNNTTYIAKANGIYNFKVADRANNITNLAVNINDILWTKTTTSDSEWYSYNDVSRSDKKVNTNAPRLKGNMKPIKYTGPESSTQKGSKWANAMTTDESMWVWIPRYAYKITRGYNSMSTGTIEVAFIDTNNRFLNGETGVLTTNPEEAGAGETKWLVHPAFTAKAEYGGGFGELSGLWIGKFETTGSYTTGNSNNVSVKPGVSSLRNMIANDQYKAGKNARYGESVDLKSHMAKNSEWGVTVYLAHSKYGVNEQNVEKNINTSYYTGGTNNIADIYTTNKKQSSTYNATGIYDLNGGTWERTSGYLNNGTHNLGKNGGNSSGDLYGKTKLEQETSTEYKTVYTSRNDPYYDYKMTEKKHKGAAIYETSYVRMGDGTSWRKWKSSISS